MGGKIRIFLLVVLFLSGLTSLIYQMIRDYLRRFAEAYGQ